MPIYKMQGKKDGLQKYRVRINYTDRSGKPRQLDRVPKSLNGSCRRSTAGKRPRRIKL